MRIRILTIWHGRCFRVHDPIKFVSMVLPHYFSQTKYRSFQRQLNHYGFERIVKGPLEGYYKHPSFLRDDKELCESMGRIKRKTTKKNAKASASKEGANTNTTKSWKLPSFPIIKPLLPVSTVSASSSVESAKPFYVASRSHSITSHTSDITLTSEIGGLSAEDEDDEVKADVVRSGGEDLYVLESDPFEVMCDRVCQHKSKKDPFSTKQAVQQVNFLFLTECDFDIQ